MEQTFWKKYGGKIIIGLLILAGLLACWLLYQRYLKPQYELTQLLPKDHQISFEFKSDRFSLPLVQQQKMLNNPTIAEVYSAVAKDLNAELAKFSQEAMEILEKSQHQIFFYQTPEKYGLIIEIPNQKTFKKIGQVNFEGFYKQTIREQILALANDEELLNQMVGQKITATSIPYLSLTIDPWLTIRFQDSFLEASYDNAALSGAQQVLQPLKNTETKEYYLEMDSDSLAIDLILKPKETNEINNQLDLTGYLDFIQKEPDLVLGLTDLEDLKYQLDNNQSLQSLWQKFDSQLWISRQLSLTNLLKQLKSPIILSLKGNNFQILTNSENRDLAEYYLKSYLAQFSPKEILKVLPDGTAVTELVADFSKISWQESSIGDWQSFSLPESGHNLGFAQKDGLLLVTNNLSELNFSQFQVACSFGSKQQPINPIKSLISLNSGVSWLKLADVLKNFSNINLISSSNGQIKVCLGL